MNIAVTPYCVQCGREYDFNTREVHSPLEFGGNNFIIPFTRAWGGAGLRPPSGSEVSRVPIHDVEVSSEAESQDSSSPVKPAENRVSEDDNNLNTHQGAKAYQNAPVHHSSTHGKASEPQEGSKDHEEMQLEKHSGSSVAISTSISDIESTLFAEFAPASPTQTRQLRTRHVSSMRWFLESNQRIAWPLELNQTRDGHYVLPSTRPFPFTRKKHINLKLHSRVDEYVAESRFKFGKTFAIKKIVHRTPNHQRDLAQGVDGEIKIVRSLHHPHCITSLGSFIHSEKMGYLLFPPPQCSLADVMQLTTQLFPILPKTADSLWRGDAEENEDNPAGFLTSDQCIDILRRCFVCLSQGLSYLHKSEIIQGDIKPRSILVDGSGSVLFADFSNSSTSYNQTSTIIRYTRRYAPPEIVEARTLPHLTKSSDVYSLGCVFLEIATILSGRELPNFWCDPPSCREDLLQVHAWLDLLRREEPVVQNAQTRAVALTSGPISTIRSMLDHSPEERPPALDLWECFRTVSSDLCRDCDSRHPEVWKPYDPVKTTTETTAQKSEDESSLNDVIQDPGSSSDSIKLNTSKSSGSSSVTDAPETSMSSELDRIDDLQSVPDHVETESLPSLYSGPSASSLGTTEELEGVVEELAALFLKDEILIPLYDKALKELGTDKFERNFARLLKVFATDLKTEARSPQEVSAVQFVAARAKYVASRMGKHLDPGSIAHSQALHDFLMESHEREETVELFLQRQIPSVEPADVGEIVEQKDFIGPEESEPDLADPIEQSPLRNLQDVRDFILKSAAFSTLRQAFHNFVMYGKVQNQHSTNSGEQNPVFGSTNTPTRPEEHSPGISETDSDDSLLMEEVYAKPSIPEGQPRTLQRVLISLTYFWRGVAEFLEILEKPIPPGFTRVRWTCFCGCSLFDDFQEIEPDTLHELEGFLNDRTHIHQSTNDESTSHNSSTNSMGSVAAQSSSVQGLRPTPTGRSNTTDNNLPPGLRRRQRELNDTYASSTSPPTWVLPIFQVERYGSKVKHLRVDTETSDESFFTTVKAQYLGENSRLRRILSMRGVKKISYVKFVHAPREPDIHKYDDWPLQKHSPPWVYKGCPAKRKHIPLVGHTYLMHLWHHPSHSDLQTYNNRPQGAIGALVHRMRLFKHYLVAYGRSESGNIAVNRTMNDGQGHLQQDVEMTNPNSNPSNQPSTGVPAASDTHGNRSSYVFLRTPKKLGDQLIADDEDPPEAWGLYFEEGFAIHHFLIVVLFIYILATIAFGIYWCTNYGLVGPHTGAGAFGVSSWMIGLISLVVTVWFKWAD
ncbi:MAG: hypothetical protein LQ352_005662 [Teloschistes flavicans]|nr:MAG: hypothetical protein LQ352_005662 [Teloschistes flavicans]